MLKYYLITSPIVVILGFILFLSIERGPSNKKVIIELNLGNEEKK